MKRVLCILFALLLSFCSFVSCGELDDTDEIDASNSNDVLDENISDLGHEESSTEGESAYDEGLVFELSKDETYCKVVGYNGNSSTVVVPSSYDKVPVTRIEEFAFYKKNGLETLVLPDTINHIDERGVAGCDNLTNVIITETEWGLRDTFKTCVEDFNSCKLQYNEYENGLYLGNPDNPYLVFMKMKDDSQSAISINENTKYISYGAFRDSKLSDVIIPNSVVSIGNVAFQNCDSLRNVDISDFVLKIGISCFGGCSLLTKLDLPKGLEKIERTAFANCDALAVVDFPEGLEEIGSGAFEGCDSLVNVNIPNSIKKISCDAFEKCGNLAYNVIPYNEAKTHCAYYLGNENNPYLVLAEYTAPTGFYERVFEIHKDTKILLDAFRGMNVSSIEIPDSVCYIGSNAFAYCRSLTEIEIPDSVEYIGSYAFANCNELEKVSISKSVAEICEGTFQGCWALKSVEIPETVVKLGIGAFADTGLIDVVIPNFVTHFEGSTFSGCDNLVNVTLPSNVTGICYRMFSGCESLTNIVIPDSVTYIGSGAFSECGLRDISILPESVTEIGDSAFSGCESLISASIPYSVTKIGEEAFYGCPSLTSVTIPESVNEIGEYAFSDCESLESIIIPGTVEVMGAAVFKNCKKMTCIYCESVAKPEKWSDQWTYMYSGTVRWGYKE